MRPIPRNEINGNPGKPADLAFHRLYYLTSESALDEECHLWEAWIKFLQKSNDIDRIISPTEVQHVYESDDIWFDVAFGFKIRRLEIAKGVLKALGALKFPVTIQQNQQLKSAFRRARNLEQEIRYIVTRLSLFRDARGSDSNPTIWEVLSDTFTQDLYSPRNVEAHELDWEGSDGDNCLSNCDNDRESEYDENTEEFDFDPLISPLENKVVRSAGPPVPLTCPQPGCSHTTAGQSNLRRHFFSHTQADTHFQCLFCPYHAMHYRTLKRHAQVVHGLTNDGPMLLEMLLSGSRRLEALFRKAQGLTGDGFEIRVWL